MMTFVCFLWKRNTQGFKLPSVCDYTARHVNVLRNMLERHVHMPHRLVCVTDDAKGIDRRVETVPLWDKCRDLGGCYNRLWVFSEDARELFGPRFACIDLDCVILKDCTDLFTRDEDFIINSYYPTPPNYLDQYYNGGLFMMTAGARSSVWDEFDPARHPEMLQADARCIGTDQAWIRVHLGKGEARYTQDDGVYEARIIGPTPPANARLVMFAGKRDPSKSMHGWVRRAWR